jgi:hypothetical protein
MLESKSVATDRLRKEGRWEEASLWRDQKRGELRAEGQTRTESNEAAWQAMIEQFPPLPSSEVQSPGGGHAVELLDIDPDSYDGQSGCAGDMAWVYQNLSVKSAAPHQAPSSGAWGLLQWARRNTDKFFPLWAKMMPQQAGQYPESWRVADEHIHRNIDRMRSALKGGYDGGMASPPSISG